MSFQLSFCCCQGSLCNWAPQQLDLTSAKHSRGRSSRGEQEKKGAAEGSGGLHAMEQYTGGQTRGGHGGGGQGSGVESKLLPSMSASHYTMTPTELGLLTALVSSRRSRMRRGSRRSSRKRSRRSSMRRGNRRRSRKRSRRSSRKRSRRSSRKRSRRSSGKNRRGSSRKSSRSRSKRRRSSKSSKRSMYRRRRQ